MPLLRHIAGTPTATEQRCIRCCDVIGCNVGVFARGPYWPGQEVIDMTEAWTGTDGAQEDCKPVDLLPIEPVVDETFCCCDVTTLTVPPEMRQTWHGNCPYCGKQNEYWAGRS